MLCGCPSCNPDKEFKNFFLVKFVEDPYATDMWENDYLYFNLLKKFRGKERTADGRSDPREGITRIDRFDRISILKEDQVIAKGGKGKMEHYNSDYRVKSCSLYRWELDSDLQFLPIDDRILHKGKKAIVIQDKIGFLKSFDEYNRAKTFHRHVIHYFDPETATGELSLLCKDKFFSFEKEYRLIVMSDFKGPMKVKIPNLKKFSFIADTKDLLTFKFSLGAAS